MRKNTLVLGYPRKIFRRGAVLRRDIDQLLEKIRQASPVRLHLGCGSKPIPGMINCDLHHEAADCKLDATDLHEFADSSVDLIEHHHLIEHLSLARAQKAIQEWGRVLRPGGFLVMTCPDLSRVVRKWLWSSRASRWGKVIQMIYGSQEHEGMFHRSGYDRRQLSELLARYHFQVEFHHYPYPSRSTPSMLLVSRKR